MALQNLRSNTANKRPTASGMVDGQVAINTNATNPGLFFKDAGDGIRKVGPVFIGSSAPNSSPAAGGSTGHSIGEQWLDTSGSRYVLKTWDGTAWRDDDSNYLQLTGGALSGALTIDNAANVAALDLKFDGDTDTGFYSPSANTLGVATGGIERLRFDSSGRVGIGTTSPNRVLEIQNASPIIRLTESAGTYSEISASTSILSFRADEGNGATNTRMDFRLDGSEKMRIDSDGRVLIGTSSGFESATGALLQIKPTSNVTPVISLMRNDTSITDGNNLGQLAFYSDDGTPVKTAHISAAASQDHTSTARGTDIVFSTTEASTADAPTERLRIDSSGRVGIGTSSPAHAVHIAGATTPELIVEDTTNNVKAVVGADNTVGRIGTDTNHALTLRTNDTERMRIDSSGNVGVGTTTPDRLLQLSASGAAIRITDTDGGGNFDIRNENGEGIIETRSGHALVFKTSQTEAYRVTYDGKVGIGTSSPGFKLEVNSGTSDSVALFKSSDTTARIILRDNGSTSGGYVGVATEDMFFHTNGAERLRIDSSGNIKQSVASGTNKGFTVNNGTNDLFAFGTGGFAVNGGNSTNGGIRAYNNLVFGTGSSSLERMRIDSSGQVIIGGTSPLDSTKQLTLTTTATSGGLGILSPDNGRGDIFFGDASDDNVGQIRYSHVDNSMTFRTNTTDKFVIDSSGNVGIGTTSPTNAKLVVSNSTNGVEGIRIDDTRATPSANKRTLDIRYTGTNGRTASNTQLLYLSDNNASSTEPFMEVENASNSLFVIDSSGNVGIGNASPTAKLIVGQNPNGSTLTSGGGALSLARNGNTFLEFWTTGGTQSSKILFNQAGTEVGNIEYVSSTLRFDVNQSERMRIDSSGRLLIGTSSGTDTGSESNLIIESNSSGDSSYGGLMLRRGSTGIGDNTSLGRIYFADKNGNTGARISALGDGTWATNDYPGVLIFDTVADGEASFTERMRIDSSGNVGIGHNSPESLLTVGGDAISTTKPTVAIAPESGNGSITLRRGSPTFFFDVTAGGNGTIIYDSGSDLLFKNGTLDSSTEHMRLDGDGRLLVGTSSSSADCSTVFEGSSTSAAAIVHLSRSSGVNNGSTLGAVSFSDNAQNRYAQIKAAADAEPSGSSYPGRLLFLTTANGSTSLTERMRISSSGLVSMHRSSGTQQLRIGTIDGSTFANFENYMIMYGGSASDYVLTRACNTADGTPGFEIVVDGTRRIEIESDGDIFNVNGTYGTISDARLKENIVDASSQWDDIKDLQVRNFNFTVESGLPTNTQIGFVAQEVEQVSPGLVKTNPDEDKDGNDLGTTTKTVKTSVLLVKAVKALQEAMDRIETLEAKVAALEAE